MATIQQKFKNNELYFLIIRFCTLYLQAISSVKKLLYHTSLSMRIVSKIFWIISCIGFLFALFTSYGNATEKLWLGFDDINQFPVSRNAYFYGALAVFMLFNLLLVAIANLVIALPKPFLFIPKKDFWLGNRENRKDLNTILQSWVYFSACVLNMLLVVVCIYFGEKNHANSLTSFQKYWLFDVVFVMAFSLVLPFFRLFIPKGNLLDNSEQ